MNIVSLDSIRSNKIPMHAVLSGAVVPKVISINDTFFANEEKEQIDDKTLTEQYKQEILIVIRNDIFEDGITTASEKYIADNYNEESCGYIKAALMNIYLENLTNEKILTGVLMMISSIPFENAKPQGPIMALGLLQNMNYSVRDKAVQAFERWNSKQGIPVLRSLKCDRKWLQKYVDKVIVYLERDGID